MGSKQCAYVHEAEVGCKIVQKYVLVDKSMNLARSLLTSNSGVLKNDHSLLPVSIISRKPEISFA